MRSKQNWISWLKRWLLLPLLTLNGWILWLLYGYFQPLIHTLLTAALLAFLLNFPVRLLQRFSVPRGRAVVLVFLGTVSCLSVLGITLLPILASQVEDLAHRLPTWGSSGNAQLLVAQQWLTQHYPGIDLLKVQQQFSDQIAHWLQSVGQSALGWLPNAIEGVVRLFLTAILTFYLLLHGPRLWAGLFEAFPWDQNDEVQALIARNFQNYFLGQLAIASLVAVLLSIGFSFVGLPYGIIFGLAMGVFALFPFGKTVGLAIITGLAVLSNVWLGIRVFTVGLLVDQMTEQAIVPLLMGHLTGLNPVWILVSLLVGAKVAGLLGLVMAVPTAATLKQWWEMRRIARNPEGTADTEV